MPHERHGCGLTKWNCDDDLSCGGLRQAGEAGPIWSVACLLLSIMARRCSKERAGSGVALHAKPAVAAQAQFRVDYGDLTALLYLQGYRKTDFVDP